MLSLFYFPFYGFYDVFFIWYQNNIIQTVSLCMLSGGWTHTASAWSHVSAVYCCETGVQRIKKFPFATSGCIKYLWGSFTQSHWHTPCIFLGCTHCKYSPWCNFSVRPFPSKQPPWLWQSETSPPDEFKLEINLKEKMLKYDLILMWH